MVQSTINSQCGQLQSACSHAIRSKFQARFRSVYYVVSPSTRSKGVMTVQSWLSGREMAEMELINWDQSRCLCVWDHCTAGEVICSCCFRFDCKWWILRLKFNRPSYRKCFLQLLTNTLWKFNFSPVCSAQMKLLSLLWVFPPLFKVETTNKMENKSPVTHSFLYMIFISHPMNHESLFFELEQWNCQFTGEILRFCWGWNL